MAVLTRWNPMSEMLPVRQLADRLIDQAFVLPRTLLGTAVTDATVPFDLIEENDAVIFRAAVPGLDPGSIELTVQENTLTFKGQRRLYAEDEAQKYTWHTRGLTEGAVQVSATLPVEVNADAAEASYEHGILYVRVPKAEAVKPKPIQIKSGQVREALPAGV